MSSSSELYRFAKFELDPRERRLCCDGQTLPIMPKACDVLLALVRNAGRLVTKQALLEAVWPDCFVDEGILAVHVSNLRRVLAGADPGVRFIETIPRSGYRFVGDVELCPRRPNHRYSVAVLPSTALSEAARGGDHALTLTVADATISRLGRCSEILVRPMGAVYRLPEALQGPISAGRALNVDAVVSINLRRMADYIRVSAELVRSSDGAELWQREFTVQPDEVLTVPMAVAAAVIKQLASSLPKPGTPAPFNGDHPAEVYELFGRGRAYLLTASRSEVPKAISSFQAAIDLDPTYAAAHAGIALAYCAQAEFRLAPHADAFANIKTAAMRALELDESSADAHVALGAMYFFGAWDWPSARAQLEQALHINPNHTEAYLLLGRLLEATSDIERGLQMKQRALERDPMSALVHLQIALSYWHLRQYDTSIEWAMKSLSLDPKHLGAREQIAAAWWKKGDFDRYLEEVTTHAETCGVPVEFLNRMQRSYSQDGPDGFWRFIIDAARQQTTSCAVQLAIQYSQLGDTDSAFRYLNCALDERDPCLVYLAVAPQWDALRTDPRFESALERMGLLQTPDYDE